MASVATKNNNYKEWTVLIMPPWNHWHSMRWKGKEENKEERALCSNYAYTRTSVREGEKRPFLPSLLGSPLCCPTRKEEVVVLPSTI